MVSPTYDDGQVCAGHSRDGLYRQSWSHQPGNVVLALANATRHPPVRRDEPTIVRRS
jgi:hypothetical protein